MSEPMCDIWYPDHISSEFKIPSERNIEVSVYKNGSITIFNEDNYYSNTVEMTLPQLSLFIQKVTEALEKVKSEAMSIEQD